MITCQAYLDRKAEKLVINNHVYVSKKAIRAGKVIFSDFVIMKVPQDSDIAITNKD